MGLKSELTQEFHPLFRNPHLATIAGNFWRRDLDVDRFPMVPVRYRIDEFNTILSLEHQPVSSPWGQVICLHGLEGSAGAGYLQSLTQACLCAGLGVHRLNLRSCGNTEDLCQTMYHSGLTSDTWLVIATLRKRFPGQPVFLVGFSLGGNVALKLAGEYDCRGVLAGVVGVSAPIDLAACVHELDRKSNILYSRRFLDRLKGRIRRKSISSPDLYRTDKLSHIGSIWAFDDEFTAPLFGFGTAENYYRTQSAQNFIPQIQIPGLLITAEDDPLVPFRSYRDLHAIANNPNLTLLAPRYGGHIGFLSRSKPRFWVDGVIVAWLKQQREEMAIAGTPGLGFSSV